MEVQKSISKTLISLREEAGLSQEALAHKANLHRTFISQIERELKMPTILSIFKICSALDIKPSDFIKKIEEDFNVRCK